MAIEQVVTGWTGQCRHGLGNPDSLILSECCIEMDPVKIAGVKEWLTPRNVIEVFFFQSFVSLISFYQRFIPDFSHIAKPLHQLTKEEPWCWTKLRRVPLVNSNSLLVLHPWSLSCLTIMHASG